MAEQEKTMCPPESTRRAENCSYRIDGDCYNAVNYLRPWTCNNYCIAKLDGWVREYYSTLSDDEVKEKVRELVQAPGS